MQQKDDHGGFREVIAGLIAKQRNPNVPDMTLNDAVQIALKQNPDILNAIQQIRITRGQLIQVASQAVPQIVINSQYRNQAEALTTNGRGSQGPLIGEIPNPNGGRPTRIVFSSAIASPFRIKAGTFNFKAPSSSSTAARRIMGSKAESQLTTARFSASARRSTTLSLRSSTSFTKSSSIGLSSSPRSRTWRCCSSRSKTSKIATKRAPCRATSSSRSAAGQRSAAAHPGAERLSDFDLSAGSSFRNGLSEGHPSEVPFNVVGTLGYSPRRIDTDESIRVAIARNPSLKAQRQAILSMRPT